MRGAPSSSCGSGLGGFPRRLMYKVGCLEPPAATSGPFLGAAPGVRAACGSRARPEFAFSSAPRSGSEDSSAAPEDLRRGLGRLRRALHCAQNPRPAKTQRAGAQTLARAPRSFGTRTDARVRPTPPLHAVAASQTHVVRLEAAPLPTRDLATQRAKQTKSIARHAITGAGSRKSAAPKTR